MLPSFLVPTMIRASRAVLLAVYALSLGLLSLCPCGPDRMPAADAHDCCSEGPALRAVASDCCATLAPARTPEAVVDAPLAVVLAPASQLVTLLERPAPRRLVVAVAHLAPSPPSVLRV